MRRFICALALAGPLVLVSACSSDPAATPVESAAVSTPVEPVAAVDPPVEPDAAVDPPVESAAVSNPVEPVAAVDPPVAPVAAVDWHDPAKVVTLDVGTTVAACEGSGPFLCVEKDGAFVGTLEMLRFPLQSFDIIDPQADDATNIRAVAANFVEAISADRTATCGDGYRFEPLPVDEFVLDGRTAFRYGYRATMADGSPAELNLQFATISGGELVLITAIANDQGACPGRDDQSGFDTETLTALQADLEAVLRATPIPTT